MNPLSEYFLKQQFGEVGYQIVKCVNEIGQQNSIQEFKDKLKDLYLPDVSQKDIQRQLNKLQRHGVISIEYEKQIKIILSKNMKEFEWFYKLGKRNPKKKQIYSFDQKELLTMKKFPIFLYYITTQLGKSIIRVLLLFNQKGSVSVKELKDNIQPGEQLEDLLNQFMELINRSYVRLSYQKQTIVEKELEENYMKFPEDDKDKKQKKKLKRKKKIKKRKQNEIQSYSQTELDKGQLFWNPQTQKYIYYRLNFQQLIKQMRIQWLVRTVKFRIDDDIDNQPGSLIFQELLKRDLVNEEQAITSDQVYELMEDEKIDIQKFQIEKILKTFTLDDVRFIQTTKKSGQKKRYFVNKTSVIQNLKMKMVEMYISTNLSPQHARVFRFLKSVGLTNQKQVQQKCIMYVKETRQILYQLHFRGFIQMKMNKDKQLDPIYFFNPTNSIRNAIKEQEILLLKLKKVYDTLQEQRKKQVFNENLPQPSEIEKIILKYERCLLKLKRF